MRTLPLLLLLAEEEMTNITPSLTKWLLKFLLVFAVITVIGFLTPAMAKKVDSIREQTKQKHPDDPNSHLVRGIYDMPTDHESEDETSE